jgi:hypothetical protein
MMIGRGATHGRVGRGVHGRCGLRTRTFRGDLIGWRARERSAISEFLVRFARVQPRLAMLAC